MKRLEFFLMLFFAALLAIPGNAQNDDKVFYVVEEMPEFPGGDKELRQYIANNVEYPEEAQKNNIEGKVFVSFVVAKDGNVKDAKIERGVAPSIDNEALRVVNSLPKWTPGKQRGQAVNVKFTVPINFELGGKKNTVESGEDEEVIVFQVVEDMPEFPGGDNALRKYITENIKYPVVAKKNGIEGKVYISFVVTKDGNIKDVTIARGVAPSLDKEALRVVKSLPEWQPGKQRGKKVDVQFTMPINFALGEDK